LPARADPRPPTGSCRPARSRAHQRGPLASPPGEGSRMRQSVAERASCFSVPTAERAPGRNLPWHCWGEYPPRHEHTTTISGRPADDPRQHARQRRAVARLAVPPPGDPERRPVARSRASAIVRPTHGLHPLRNHRCPAELARATGAAERRWHCGMAVSAERHRALRLLVGSPLGVTEAIMLAHGFTNAMLNAAMAAKQVATAPARHAGALLVAV
jgi:hypothetical protein